MYWNKRKEKFLSYGIDLDKLYAGMGTTKKLFAGINQNSCVNYDSEDGICLITKIPCKLVELCTPETVYYDEKYDTKYCKIEGIDHNKYIGVNKKTGEVEYFDGIDVDKYIPCKKVEEMNKAYYMAKEYYDKYKVGDFDLFKINKVEIEELTKIERK